MSPATPSSTGGGHALGMHSTSSTSGSSYDASGSHSALSSQIEPSPASTNGTSAASDSGIPLTPDNDGTCFFSSRLLSYFPPPSSNIFLQCHIMYFFFLFSLLQDTTSPSCSHTKIRTILRAFNMSLLKRSAKLYGSCMRYICMILCYLYLRFRLHLS